LVIAEDKYILDIIHIYSKGYHYFSVG